MKIKTGDNVAHEDPDGTKLWCGTVRNIDKNGIATVQYWTLNVPRKVHVSQLQLMDSFPNAAMRALDAYFT